MASPTIVDSVASTRGGSTTSHSITGPTSPTAGNLLIAFVGFNTVITPSTSSTGWTRLGFIQHASSASSVATTIAVFVGIAGTAGALVVSSSGSQQSASVMLEVSGHNGTAGVFMETTGSSSGTGTSSTISYPSLAPPTGMADYLAIAFASNATPIYVPAAPSGYAVTPTSGVPRSATGAAGANCGVFWRATTKFAGISPGTGTISSTDRWVATTLAVQPGTGGGTDPGGGTPTRKRGSFAHLVGAP